MRAAEAAGRLDELVVVVGEQEPAFAEPLVAAQRSGRVREAVRRFLPEEERPDDAQLEGLEGLILVADSSPAQVS